MRHVVAVVLLVVSAAPVRALTVVTVGKQATFRSDSALVRFGKDRAFATLVDPTCTGGAPTALRLAWYPQATARLVSTAEVTLDCARWRKVGARYRYEDAAGAALGAQRVDYGRNGLVVHFGGAQYVAPAGPVGYAELWVTLGTQRLNGRFHNFRRNTSTLLVARKPSSAAAAGEAAFWDVLDGDDASEAREQQAMRLLGRAARLDRHDGWSPFLLGMFHLYRFGASIADYAAVGDESRAEITAATAAFDRGLPLVWDGAHGDSRAPGFVAAAKFARGVVTNDAALAAAGLADLDAAVAVNPFFNVFDLIPVVQALPRGDPRFTAAVQQVLAYLNDPETLPCVAGQPEICANDGLAPRNLSGSLLLFGDVNAKSGDLAAAQQWYGLAHAITAPGYRFQDVVDDRFANAAARVAAYLDGDPSNEPQVVGTRAEACATCHNR